MLATPSVMVPVLAVGVAKGELEPEAWSTMMGTARVLSPSMMNFAMEERGQVGEIYL